MMRRIVVIILTLSVGLMLTSQLTVVCGGGGGGGGGGPGGGEGSTAGAMPTGDPSKGPNGYQQSSTPLNLPQGTGPIIVTSDPPEPLNAGQLGTTQDPQNAATAHVPTPATKPIIGPLTVEQARARAQFQAQWNAQLAQQFIIEGQIMNGLEWAAWLASHGASIAAAYASGGTSTAAQGIGYSVGYGVVTALAGGASANQAAASGHIAAILYYYHPLTGELVSIGIEYIQAHPPK